MNNSIFLSNQQEIAPKISVVMPVYNGERFLREAIDSILNQTYKDFEFIIIDDGSTDQTSAILDSYHDPRIVRLTHPTNLGLVQSLNDGIAIARGEYIARMDADDISLPERFEKQVAFMESHPEIGVLGSQTIIVDTNGIELRSAHYPYHHDQIIFEMCFSSPLPHPTVMLRKDILMSVNGYRDFKASEDFDLWQRLSIVTKFENLQEFLLYYRIHENNRSGLLRSSREEERKEIKERAMINILGSNFEVIWDRFWSDPFYSAVICMAIRRAMRSKVNRETKEFINRRVGNIVYSKSSSIEKTDIIRKIYLYFSSFYINPKLIIKFWNQTLQRLKVF